MITGKIEYDLASKCGKFASEYTEKISNLDIFIL